MSTSRPTNREILERFESHVRTNQNSMIRLDAQLGELKEDIAEIKANQLTAGKVLSWIAVSISGTIGTIIALLQLLK